MTYFDSKSNRANSDSNSAQSNTGQNPEDELVKEITKLPTQMGVVKSTLEAEQDTIFQVFFKKNDFFDMKMDSPHLSSPKLRMIEKKNNNNLESDDCDGLNFWKLSFAGIGAICSFGIATATICILFFENHHRNKQIKHNQKIQFQIYTDEKMV
ncbi:hypothetical protein UlMin_004222 [Ulmus minor]